MSIFKTSGVITKIDKLGNKDFIYTIFTLDYGKIKVNKKLKGKEKTLDLGHIINFEIETKPEKNIHKIRNIKIKSEFLNKNRTFSEINNYLILLNTINNKITIGVPVNEIYDIVEKINSLIPKSKDINIEIKLILASLKIIDIAGDLDINHKDKMVSKILKFININKINSILKLNGIENNIKIELEKLI